MKLGKVSRKPYLSLGGVSGVWERERLNMVEFRRGNWEFRVLLRRGLEFLVSGF